MLLVVEVYVKVKAEHVDAFKNATLANAAQSIREAGIARFDVLQSHEDPTVFQLIEVYRHEQATAAHKASAHYKAWRDDVEPMMAEARQSKKYWNVFPDDSAW